MICMDPVKTPTAKFLNAKWIASRQNTNVALMMDMASHLIAKKKVNYEFLDTCTIGFDKLKTI